MNIKLIALDMDGTTLCSDHLTITPENRTAIETAIARGIHVVTATGRMRNRIPLPMQEIDGLRYLITSNGAAVTDLATSETLYTNPISRDAARVVFDTFADLPVYMEAYCDGNSYTDSNRYPLLESFPLAPGRMQMMHRCLYQIDDLPAFALGDGVTLEKINFPYLPPELTDEVWKRLRGIDGVSLTSSVAHNAEVNALNANKADGLSHLCMHLGITRDEVLAVGDNGNDVEMLQFAGLSAAPSNATEQVRSIVDYVSCSNDESAVARILEKYIL